MEQAPTTDELLTEFSEENPDTRGSNEAPRDRNHDLADDEIDYDPISGLPVMSAVPVSLSVPSKYAHGQ